MAKTARKSEPSQSSLAMQDLHSYEGVVEVCCHRVSFRYWNAQHEITPEVERALEQAAEDRAKECLNDGCCSGELNCLYVFDDGSDEEIRGWWDIGD